MTIVKTKKAAESTGKAYLKINNSKYICFNSIAEMMAHLKKIRETNPAF
jgi:hypothetical protein